MTTFHLTVVTPDGCAFDGQAERVVCRAIDGDLAILAKHGDYCTALGMGEAHIVDADGQRRRAACMGGMLTVLNGDVHLVATTWEWAEEIDQARAEASKKRAEEILAWKDLDAHRLGAGLQQYRASIALSRGGLDGVGLGNSAEKHGTLPFAHTDFIFAPLGEEFGFYGTMFVLLCYFLMTYAGIGVAMQCRDAYGRFLAVGIVAIIFCPAILNIAVVTNAVPNSGLPLPFISFGGTNLVFTLAALGMLTSIQRFSTGAQPNCEITRKDERSIDVRL